MDSEREVPSHWTATVHFDNSLIQHRVCDAIEDIVFVFKPIKRCADTIGF